MDLLHKRSDGVCETPSGQFAIVPLYASGDDGQTRWFEFKSDVFSEATRVQWPSESDFVLLEADTALAMVRLGYAKHLPDDMLAQYNAIVASQPSIPAGAPAGTAASPVTPATAAPVIVAPVAETRITGEDTQPSPAPDVYTPPAGWAPHPTAPGFYYKGQEVLSEVDLKARG